MKKLILTLAGIILLTSCGTPGTSARIKPVKLDKETFYYFTEAMYERPDIMRNIEHVLNDVESRNDIKFYEHASPGKDIVTFDTGDGNYSWVGKVDSQVVMITSGTLDIAYHEIFHCLGMWHEHQNIYRDSYVKLINEDSSRSFDFELIPSEMFLYNVDEYPYDMKSIVHYTEWGNGNMIKDINGSKIKRNLWPSKMDWQKLKGIYGGK